MIATMEAGFIGLWGEWWYSDHFVPDGDWSDRGEVVARLLEVLPPARAILVRAPRYKQSLYGDVTPLDPTTAHGASDKARIGHHNDCFVSSSSDGGTYVDPTTEYPYLEQDTQWVPMGGETCDHQVLSDPEPGRLDCAVALDELARFHWSFLNLDWYRPTLRKWLDEGCFEEIASRLGYRLRFLQGAYDDQIRPGDAFSFTLNLTNDGFAAPINPRAAELILRHSDGAVYAFPLDQDPRLWLPGLTISVSAAVQTPEDLPPGDYEVLLNLPDPEETLRQRPVYSIGFSNPGMWEPDTGYNKLDHTLIVAAEALDTDSDGLPDVVETNTGTYNGPTDTGTDPNAADSDGDGLADGAEVSTYSTDPTLRDSDADGFGDGVEQAAGTNPNSEAGPWPAADGDLAPVNIFDGVVNAADVVVAARMALGLVPQDALAIAHGDLATSGTSAGIIDSADLALVMKRVLNRP